MSAVYRILDGLMRVIRMNDKIESLSAALIQQQARIEDLTARTVRLETALEIALAGQASKAGARRKTLPPPER